MDIALATLLISSLSCVGLLALWAATSPRHWFLRTAVFLGVVSLLLLIPAYEPWVAFVLQGAIVAGGIQLRRWRSPVEEDPTSGARFSMASMLQAVVFVAVFAAVGANLPVLNLPTWRSVLLTGALGGIVTLLSYWVFCGQRPLDLFRLAIGLLCAFAVAAGVSLGDWFFISITNLSGWPVLEDYFGLMQDAALPVWQWTSIAGLQLCAITSFLFLGWLLPVHYLRERKRQHRWLTVAGLLVLSAPSVFVYWELMNPLPLPEVKLPQPNGSDQLQQACTLVGNNMWINSGAYDPGTNTLAQLQQCVKETQPVLELARSAIDQPCMIDLDYFDQDWIQTGGVQNIRAIARGFAAETELARRQQDYQRAMECSLDLIRYGYCTRRGGLLIDELVGIACSGIGRSDLYWLRGEMNANQCEEAIDHISASLQLAEPIEAVHYRDKVWSQRALGWHGRLTLLAHELIAGVETWGYQAARDASLREQTEMRLLLTELALRIHQIERNEWPKHLSELSALKGSIPTDPFDHDKRPLRFIPGTDGYVLYSIGPNRINDSGLGPDPNSLQGIHLEGDLRLDVHYGPEPPAVNDPNSLMFDPNAASPPE